jgi:hypothetical protein
MTAFRFLLVPTALAFVVSACGDSTPDETGPCRVDDDCGEGQQCDTGVCVADECTDSADCEAGLICLDGDCAVDPDAGDAEPDAGDATDASSDATDGSADGADSDVVEPDADSGDSAEADSADAPDVDYGPLSWVVRPSEGTMNVALDTTVEVEWNQPMNALRFIPANLTLSSYDGASFSRAINYDPETFVLALSPESEEDAPLPPATPIYFRMEEFLSSTSGLSLGDPVTTRFVTAGYGGVEFQQSLAVSYAPVVYQQIERSGIDTFTNFEFDGDEDLTNNLDSAARPAPNPGHVYYAVLETDTHFFISYVLYYPGVEQNRTETAEHDMIGMQVIVEKTVADPLGRLWAASLMQRSSYSGWAMQASWYAETTLADGDDIQARLNPDALEDGRRMPLFVESAAHDGCFVGYPDGRCTPTSGEGAPFEEETRGVIYRAGGVAQRVGDGPDTALTYVLLPFTDAVWLRRDLTAGPGAPFGGSELYYPPFEDEASETLRPGAGRFFPATLAYAHDGDSFGELPFTWARNESFPPDNGLWFVDPAWLAAEKWALPDTASTTYCFNPWLGIDARNDRVTCTDPDFTLP